MKDQHSECMSDCILLLHTHTHTHTYTRTHTHTLTHITVARTRLAIYVDSQEARARHHCLEEALLTRQLSDQVRHLRHRQAMREAEAVVEHGIHLHYEGQ